MRHIALTWGMALLVCAACGRRGYEGVQVAPDADPTPDADTSEPVSTSAIQLTATGPDSCHPQVVYTGNQQFVIWVEKPSNDIIYMMEIAADGSPLSAPQIIGMDANAPGDLVAIWTGNAVAVVWTPGQRLTYSLAQPDGTSLVDSKIVADSQGKTTALDLTSHDESLAAVYRRGSDTAGSIRSLVFDDIGNVVGGPTDLSPASGDVDKPEIAWGTQVFMAVWEEGDEIRARTVGPSGVPGSNTRTIYAPVRPGFSAAWAGDRHGVAFTSDPLTTGDVRLAVLDEAGGVMTEGDPPILAAGTQPAREPAMAWSGTHFGVVFIREGLQFVLVDASGEQVGDAIAVDGSDFAELPDVTWAGDRFIVTWQAYDADNKYQLYGAAITL